MADDLCEPLALPLLRALPGDEWTDLSDMHEHLGEPAVATALRIGVAYGAAWIDIHLRQQHEGDQPVLFARLTGMGREVRHG